MIRSIAYFFRRIPKAWNHDFVDSRIIIERQGDLSYWMVSARLQQLVVRTSMAATAATVVVLAALTTSLISTQWQKSRLEASHREIYEALFATGSDLRGRHEPNVSTGELRELAAAIRERDLEIRRFVDSSTAILASQNASLKVKLDSAGLTERAIRVIQGTAPLGGFTTDDPSSWNPLLRGGLAEESARNHALKDILSALPTQMPVESPSFSSNFGFRIHPTKGTRSFHTGVDMLGSNDDVRAVRKGRIIFAQSYGDYGKTVMIKHERGIETLYAHLDSIAVESGQDVAAGQVIGRVGNTGVSTGKHLHFEILIGGYPVDPRRVIETAQHVQYSQK